MDAFGDNIQHPLLASGGASTRLLENEGHREALVQDSKLAVFGLGIAGVSEDAPIKKGAMYVCHHRSDVAGRVGLSAAFSTRELDVVEVLFARSIPVGSIALVDRVDLSTRWDPNLKALERERIKTYIGMSQNEFANGLQNILNQPSK